MSRNKHNRNIDPKGKIPIDPSAIPGLKMRPWNEILHSVERMPVVPWFREHGPKGRPTRSSGVLSYDMFMGRFVGKGPPDDPDLRRAIVSAEIDPRTVDLCAPEWVSYVNAPSPNRYGPVRGVSGASKVARGWDWRGNI